jgi:transcription elongation factor Elf1
MKEFVCPKCKSKDVFVERNGTQDGLYCGSCGNWIKWLNKKELRQAERQVEKMNGISEDMEE